MANELFIPTAFQVGDVVYVVEFNASGQAWNTATTVWQTHSGTQANYVGHRATIGANGSYGPYNSQSQTTKWVAFLTTQSAGNESLALDEAVFDDGLVRAVNANGSALATSFELATLSQITAVGNELYRGDYVVSVGIDSYGYYVNLNVGGSGANDYDGCRAVISRSNDTTGQYAAAIVIHTTGSTATRVYLDRAPTFTPQVDDYIRFFLPDVHASDASTKLGDEVVGGVAGQLALLSNNVDDVSEVLGTPAGTSIADDIANVSSGAAPIPVNQVPVPTSRTWVLKPTDGLRGELPIVRTIGESQLYAVDFRHDLPNNGRLISIDSIVVDGVGITIDADDRGVDRSQAKFKIAAQTAGTYEITVTASYDDSDGGGTSTGVVTLIVK